MWVLFQRNNRKKITHGEVENNKKFELISWCFHRILSDSYIDFLSDGLFDDLVSLDYLWVNTSSSKFYVLGSNELEVLSKSQEISLKLLGGRTSFIDVNFRFLVYLKHTHLLKNKYSDNQYHPAVVSVVFLLSLLILI